MPLSTIERPRLTAGGPGGGGLPPLSGVHHPPGSAGAPGGSVSAYGYVTASRGGSSAASAAGRSIHAPSYQQVGGGGAGGVNGHTSISNAPTLR